VRSAQGLTSAEIQRVFTRFLVVGEAKDPIKAVDLVHEEKSQILRRSRVLEFYRESRALARCRRLGSIETLAEATRSGVFRQGSYVRPATTKGLFLLACRAAENH